MCALFDSLMQGYPIGEFLFWQIDPTNSAQYRYYGFVLDYHQRDHPHCPDLGVMADKPLTAVLDGQQRLTALNIGLRGSMAVKLPRRRWASPDAFPRRVLALDLLAQTQRDEDGNRYKFDFIDQSEIGRQGTHLWFQVSEILTMESGPDMFDWISNGGIDQEQQGLAFRTLDRLHRVIRTEPTIAYYEERSQDIEHVLNIFIRRNSGGTVLAYSDLLLSIAVSQWESRDARREVHDLVDDLNSIGSGLGLSKDFVLKSWAHVDMISRVLVSKFAISLMQIWQFSSAVGQGSGPHWSKLFSWLPVLDSTAAVSVRTVRCYLLHTIYTKLARRLISIQALST